MAVCENFLPAVTQLKILPQNTASLLYRGFDFGGAGIRRCWSPGSIQISPRTGSGCQWEPRAVRASGSRGPRAFSGLRGHPQDRPALGMVAERSRRVQIAQADDTGSRRGFSALGAESCLPQIPHSYLNMQPNQPKQKKYYAENLLPPQWLLREGQIQ